MSKIRIAVVVLLVLGMGVTASLVVGSLVTYAPSVSRMTVQNNYIQHIAQHGAAIFLILLSCLILTFMERRSLKDK